MRVEASFTRWGERASSTLSQSARYFEQAWGRGREGGREGGRKGREQTWKEGALIPTEWSSVCYDGKK